jgi:hypothetical protein
MIKRIDSDLPLSSNDPSQTQIISGNVFVSNLPATQAFTGSVSINNFPPATIDAFARQRISNPYTLGDYKHVYGEETELLTSLSGAGASKTLRANEASVRLAVGTGNAEYVIHQSRMYHHYMPGKSQLIYSSFVFGLPNSGTNKKIGLFDGLNGIYFQQSGNGELQLVQRDYISGYTRETIIPQTGWNIDMCNGSGDSLFNLDITKTQLFTADYQWLGVGRIRAGFVHNGNSVVAHEFCHSNNLATAYWSNPNLPIRCEIRNYKSAASGNGYFDQICSTVISEGGYSEAGVDFSVSPTGLRSVAGNSTLPILAIRLATGYKGAPNRSIVRLGKGTFSSIDQNVIYEVWRLPSSGNILGGTWTSVDDQSVVEYNSTATGINFISGNRIDCGFLAAGGNGANSYLTSTTSNVSDARQGYISQNINSSDSNIFAVAIKNITASNSNCFGSLQWRETR